MFFIYSFIKAEAISYLFIGRIAQHYVAATDEDGQVYDLDVEAI